MKDGVPQTHKFYDNYEWHSVDPAHEDSSAISSVMQIFRESKPVLKQTREFEVYQDSALRRPDCIIMITRLADPPKKKKKKKTAITEKKADDPHFCCIHLPVDAADKTDHPQATKFNPGDIVIIRGDVRYGISGYSYSLFHVTTVMT